MKKWSLLLLVVALVVALLVLTGCSSCGSCNTDTKRTLNAKVRYFDGTSEMIELKSYDFLSRRDMVKLYTAAGDTIVIGTNNVIIIDEEVRP